MKPDWDKLAGEFKGSDNVLIADVDCTDDYNKELCEKYGVEGYPTLKSFVSGGDPLGENYEGERNFDALKKHASENLSPRCSDQNYELCDESEKALLDKFRAMKWFERKKLLNAAEEKKQKTEAEFEAKSKKIEEQQEAVMKAKDEKIKSIMTAELRLLKTIDIVPDGE